MSKKSSAKEFFSELKHSPKSAILVFIFALLAAASAAVVPTSIGHIVDGYAKGDHVSFLWYAALIVGVPMGAAVYAFIVRSADVDFEDDIDTGILEKYLRKFVLLDRTYAESLGTGRLMDILSSGHRAHRQLLYLAVCSFTMSFFVTVFALISLWRIDWRVAFAAGILAGISVFAVTKLNVSIVKWRLQAKEVGTEVMRKCVKILNSKDEILANAAIDSEMEALHELRDRHKQPLYRVMTMVEGMFTVGRAFTILARSAVLGILGYALISGKTTPGQFVAAMTAIGYVEGTMQYFIGGYKDFIKSYPEVLKLASTFEDVPGRYITGYSEGAQFVRKCGHIEFKNVDFRYPISGKTVFTNFSLVLEGGKKTALIGRSGCGKTTITKLIAGFARPTSGIVEVDGQDLMKIRLDSYYPNVAYLEQEPNVFDGTVRANLLMSKPNATDEEMWGALDDAQCTFVREMEQGLDSEIGERGIALSGGQRQRLAIAKVFLRNPEIVILDEPTSALDSFSEKKITDALHRLMEGRTMIVVAHRLQTVAECDRIVVLGNGGEILADGSHAELAKKRGTYRDMLDMQSGGIREGGFTEE